MSVIAPERSLEQRMAALRVANDVRCWRADIKRQMKAGEKLFVDVLWCDDARLESWKILDLLSAAPSVGAVRASDVLRHAGISMSKTIGGLTERQWDALVSELSRATPAVRKNTLGY